ncbi:MAG TPA: SEC-C metal-binding domain-containing protein [Xanthobacteraceae bacterium]
MTERKRTGRRAITPDDYFTAGPFEFARFGKFMTMRSHASAEDVKVAQARMAAQFPVVVAEIDALVSSIASQIARLPPARLLQRVWWEYATVVIGMSGKKALDSDLLIAARMVDYVQSIIASVKPVTCPGDVNDDDWNKLKTDIESLFYRLTLEYQICLTAHRRTQDPNLDMELEEFRFQAETLWMNIRGKRYQPHERRALLDLLTPHSDTLYKLFGVDAATLVDELDKVLAKLTRGLADAVPALGQFHKDAIDRMETVAATCDVPTTEALMAKVFEDEELIARGRTVTGEVFGMDLFDVGKNTTLPSGLLDALSWSPGEETEFFAPGDFRGWPLRIWPTMRRPFIRLDGKTYCFDIFSLFDNLYRVLRRAIVQREPTYSETWNTRQQAVSEALPLTYLGKLLPGARVYHPVYYWWAPSGGRAQRQETDGLVIFDDHLFVIEVKGGAFTYTSPANDLDAHLASLRNLLQTPANQGSRFVDYLESAPEVVIADADRHEIGRLRRSDFRHVTICTVTADAFTTLAARAQHLASVGIAMGARPVWPLSVDDLRVYAELFDNPLTFLHFVEQRMRAGQSESVSLYDELDHFGLYLAQNNYAQYAANVKADGFDRLSFDGFRTPIDEYFSAVVHGELPKRPRQSVPRRLAEIITFLATANEPRRAELASFLLDGAGDFRSELAAIVEQGLRGNRELGRTRPMTIFGGMAMTLYIWSPAAPRLPTEAIWHTRTVMDASGEETRRLVELEYGEDGSLTGAHLTHVSLAGLSPAELERVKSGSLSLQRQRLTQARAKGKIGRNDICPCGSGKKYKKCHGRTS